MESQCTLSAGEQFALVLNQAFDTLSPRFRRRFASDIEATRRQYINIINNEDLHVRFNHYASTQCTNIATALQYKRLPGQIIVHVPDIGKYGIFTAESYGDLLSNYRVDLDTKSDGEPTALTASQIVFTSDQQKLIMLYTGVNATDNVKHIEQMALDCFKSGVRVLHVSDNELEITVKEPRASNYADATQLFRQFAEHVHSIRPDMYAGFRQPIVFPHGERSYFMKNISTIDESVDNVRELLGTLPPGAVINFMFGTNCVVAGEHNTANITAAKTIVDKYPGTVAWINSNEPTDTTTAYYTHYEKAMMMSAKQPISVGEFGKLMKKLGYDRHGASGKKRWVRGSALI